jgi:hypothetical protein
MWADNVNGLYELLAGFFVLNHCRRLLIDKSVRGVSLVSTIFFASWGMWKLVYYPLLGQWASFFGGLSVFGANVLWIALIIKYRKN